MTATETKCFCLKCGYDLRKLSARTCPECGKPFDPGNPRTYSDGTKSHRWRRVVAAITCHVAMLWVIAGLFRIQAYVLAWWNNCAEVRLKFSGHPTLSPIGSNGAVTVELSPLASWAVVAQSVLIVLIGAVAASVLWRALTRIYIPAAADTPLFRLTWRRFNGFLILLIAMYLGAMGVSWVCGEIDYQRVKSGQGPRFTDEAQYFLDGGTVIWQGFYYRITRHRSILGVRSNTMIYLNGPEIQYEGHWLWPAIGRLRKDRKETTIGP